MRKKNEDKKIRHVRLFDMLTGWVDLKPGAFGLEMPTHERLIIHGCSRVVEYTVEYVVAATGCGNVRIIGHKLVCAAFRDGSISVKGRILRIELGEDEHEDTQ